MSKIVTFRVYPESKRGFYFDVRILPDRGTDAAIRQQREETAQPGYFKDAEAAVIAFQKATVLANGKTVWHKTLGTIIFHRDRLGTEVIAHEATHAALRWIEAKKLMIIDRSKDYDEGHACESEERFCGALGYMAGQIVNECYDHGLYAKGIDEAIEDRKTK